MKKFISSAALVAVFLLGSNSAIGQQGSDAQLIGRARGAASDCLQEFRGNPIFTISESIEVIDVCFEKSGVRKRVIFWAGPTCHPNQENCPKFVTRQVAWVDFNCAGDISSVTCL